LTQDADEMIVNATFNVLSNNFEALVDIFLLYGHEHQASARQSARARAD